MKNTKKKRAPLVDVFIGYQSALKGMLSRIVPHADVEDIVQETFIRAHEAEVDKRLEYPKAFMYKTARNLALNFIARKENICTSKLEDTLDLDVYISNRNQIDANESKEKFRLFCSAVRELPLQCRKAFIMKRVFGHSTKEISTALDISESTTEKHIAKGVLRCAEFLEESGYIVNRRMKHQQKTRTH